MTRAKSKKLSANIVKGLEPKKRRNLIFHDRPPAKRRKLEIAISSDEEKCQHVSMISYVKSQLKH